MTGEEPANKPVPCPRGEGLLRSSEVIDLVDGLNENVSSTVPFLIDPAEPIQIESNKTHIELAKEASKEGDISPS